MNSQRHSPWPKHEPLPPLCPPPSRPDPLPFVVTGIFVALALLMIGIGLAHSGVPQ